MKNFLITIAIAALLPFAEISAQNNQGKADDADRLTIVPKVTSSNVPSAAQRMLKNKMKQLLSLNNVGGESVYPVFVMNASVDVISQETTPTAPPMPSLNMEVTFSIEDKFSEKVFSSHSINIRGVGSNETKAYITGFRNINIRTGQFRGFVEKGKEKILAYYNSHCDFFLSTAETLNKQGKHEKAMAVLKSVPPVSKECYDKCMKMLGDLDIPDEEPEEEADEEQDTAPANDSAPEEDEAQEGNGTTEVEIDENIFLVYEKMKTFGDKTILYFRLENRGDNDYEFEDYAYDTRILAKDGTEKKAIKVKVAGKAGAKSRATLIPDLPVKMECHFDKVDVVNLFEFPYDNKKFRIREF